MSAKETVNEALKCFVNKDLDGTLAMFTDDAILADPHYPRPVMHGKEEIERGLRWGMKGIREFNFFITHYFNSEDGSSASIETHCKHKLPNGQVLDFNQVFVFEFEDGRIKRCSAYLPHAPHGITGLILKVNRFFMRLLKKA